MNSVDIIAYLLAFAGFICVIVAVGFVLFLLFEDFFRKLFKMRPNTGEFDRGIKAPDSKAEKKE